MAFPLYDVLKAYARDTDLTDKEKKDMVDDITNLEEKGQEDIYAIIKFYSHHKGNETLYSAKTLSNGIKFDLENFPNELKHMLKRFIQITKESVREEEKRQQEKTDRLTQARKSRERVNEVKEAKEKEEEEEDVIFLS